jgi:hypothetical protein
VRKNATVLRPPFDPATKRSGKSSNLLNKVGRVPMLIAMIVLVAAIAAGWGVYWLNDLSAIDTEDNTVDAQTESAGPMAKRTQQDKARTFPIVSDDESTAKGGAFLAPAQLKVHSDPAQARVFIDGKDKGLTPIQTDIGNGMHSLRLSLEGYYDWKSKLLIEDKVEMPIRIPLLKK